MAMEPMVPIFFKCDRCNREFDTPIGLDRHNRMVHEKTWKVSHAPRAKKTAQKTAVPQSVEIITRTSLPAKKSFRQMEGFVILEDQDGGIWLAERIR